MHFQILAARISFAAFLIGAAIALAAVVGVRVEGALPTAMMRGSLR